MRFWFTLLFLLLAPALASARQRIQGFCETGGQQVLVASGAAASTNSTGGATTWQRSFASCTVTVYQAGTTTLASIYSDNSGTVLANPFTANADGSWFFYADNGRYDAKFSGAGIATPFTRGDFIANDFAETTMTYQAVTFSATPTFDASQASIFAMTLTGNVTSSTVSNAKNGRTISFQLCQDATGGRTFAWPANFTSSPNIPSVSSQCSNNEFFYDGLNWRPIGVSLTANNTFTNTNTFSRISKNCYVDGVTYTTISSAYNDTTNCLFIYIPPGYTETQTSAFHFNRSNVALIAQGVVTITNASGWVVDPGVNGVSIIGPPQIVAANLNLTCSGVCLDGYTGTGTALTVGGSGTTTQRFLLEDVYIRLVSAGVGATGLALNNVQQYVLQDVAFGLNNTGQVAVSTNGTGGYTGIGRFQNVHILTGASAASVKGYNFGTLTTSSIISGGNMALDTGASSICIDINGPTNDIQLQNPNCNTANTGIKVESTATSVGSVSGWFRHDSGVTNVVDFESGTQGNMLFCAECSSTDTLINNSTNPNNSVWIASKAVLAPDGSMTFRPDKDQDQSINYLAGVASGAQRGINFIFSALNTGAPVEKARWGVDSSGNYFVKDAAAIFRLISNGNTEDIQSVGAASNYVRVNMQSVSSGKGLQVGTAGVSDGTWDGSGITMAAGLPVTPGSSTVGNLPAAAGNSGQIRVVTDSTTIAAEGQTCAGSGTVTALAFSNGSTWKCF